MSAERERELKTNLVFYYLLKKIKIKHYGKSTKNK